MGTSWTILQFITEMIYIDTLPLLPKVSLETLHTVPPNARLWEEKPTHTRGEHPNSTDIHKKASLSFVLLLML